MMENLPKGFRVRSQYEWGERSVDWSQCRICRWYVWFLGVPRGRASWSGA